MKYLKKIPDSEMDSSGKQPPKQSVLSYFKLARKNASRNKTGRKLSAGWGKKPR